ncbi:MAG: hypothetical protein ABF649_14920 [Bacillus sp. (in: firmicutes)]
MIGFFFFFPIGVLMLWIAIKGDKKWKKLLVPENCYEGKVIETELRRYWDDQAGFYKEGRFVIVEIETIEKETKQVDLYNGNYEIPLGTKIDVYYNADLYGYAIIPDRGQQKHAKYICFIFGLILIIASISLL